MLAFGFLGFFFFMFGLFFLAFVFCFVSGLLLYMLKNHSFPLVSWRLEFTLRNQRLHLPIRAITQICILQVPRTEVHAINYRHGPDQIHSTYKSTKA